MLPSQREFHDLETRFKGFSGPVGSGKSMALCHEAVKLAYANPTRRGLLAAPTYKMLRDATVPALIEVLEQQAIPYSLWKSENLLTLNECGAEILLRSLGDADRLRGTNLAWFGVDELSYARREAWNQLEARLRDPQAEKLCGFGVWTPRGHNWVWKKFVEGAGDGYGLVQARPFENRFVLEVVPDYYERLKHSYDERNYRQEVLGEYLASESGLVYHAFSREWNLKTFALRTDLPLLVAFDFNVNPMCAVVAQRLQDELFVLREVVLQRSGTQEMCRMVLAGYGKHQAGIVVYGDASGRSQRTAGDSDYGIIQREFDGRFRLNVPMANPPVRDRVAEMNARLRDAAGLTTLFIDPGCTELIADFEQVQFREGTSDIDKETDKRRTHLSDALGYLVWREFGRKAKAGEQGKPLN